MSIKHFFHHLLNPHCEFCEEKTKCTACLVYEQQLFQANAEKKQLLDTIVELTKPRIEPERTEEKEFKPISNGSVPWRIRREMLEREDRERSKLIKRTEEELKEDNETLEQELLKISEENDKQLKQQDA